MIRVRFNTFETNSSSTHSLIIDTESRIEDFYNNNIGYFVREYGDAANDFSGHQVVSEAEIKDWYKKHPDAHEAQDVLNAETSKDFRYAINEGWNFGAAEDFGNDLETDAGYFISPSGDKMGWVAAYGFDG